MLKKIILLFFFTMSTLFAQNSILDKPHLKLKSDDLKENYSDIKAPRLYKKSELPLGLILTVVPFILLNPILVFEDKKIFWGLTKEISFSSLHYGRFAFEYSFLFRTFNKNHLRFSYNYDFMYQEGTTWIYFVFSPGAGYFTDTENKGAFAQTALGFFVPTPLMFLHFYLKYRYTKIFNKDKSDIHDISIGTGFVF
ncbi:MAG: hypothetical protein ABI543_11930 [Ignavibacteria bacterium]